MREMEMQWLVQVPAPCTSLTLTERAHPLNPVQQSQELMPGTPIRAVPGVERRGEKPTEPHTGGGSPRALA